MIKKQSVQILHEITSISTTWWSLDLLRYKTP